MTDPSFSVWQTALNAAPAVRSRSALERHQSHVFDTILDNSVTPDQIDAAAVRGIRSEVLHYGLANRMVERRNSYARTLQAVQSAPDADHEKRTLLQQLIELTPDTNDIEQRATALRDELAARLARQATEEGGAGDDGEGVDAGDRPEVGAGAGADGAAVPTDG